jgi:hypothetical protein
MSGTWGGVPHTLILTLTWQEDDVPWNPTRCDSDDGAQREGKQEQARRNPDTDLNPTLTVNPDPDRNP